MGRRFRPGRRKGHGGLGWSVALACLLVGVGAAGAGLAWFLQSRPAFDTATLCPVDGPQAREVILLDLTDPLSAGQTRRLRALLTARIEGAPQGTLIALAAVAPDPRPPFLRCKPQAGAEANALYENPALVAARFDEAFQQPLAKMLDDALQVRSQAESPVLESLQDVLSRLPGPGTPTRVMLVSDLLQNSPLLSVYRGEGWASFDKAGHTARLSRDLQGAQVDVIRLPRPAAGAQVHRTAEAFWTRYLDAQGVAGPPRVQQLGDL